MKIIIDAMGGDYGAKEAVKGVADALSSVKADIILCGDSVSITNELSKYEYDKTRIEVIHTTEIVTNDDSPTRVIKQKPNSSMVVGLNMLKEDKADIMISAGSTGALLTGATLIIKKIQGIDRPALAPLFRGANGVVMLIDAGANATCKPENLVQFAKMGSIYMKNILNIPNPKVGLANIGTEEHKGNELAKTTYELLKQTENINFVGNIEGRDIPMANVDVAVCEGFTGNLILKTMEGMGKLVSSILKEEVSKSLKSKIGALLLGKFDFLKNQLDASEYGGAIYLGIEKPVIKCHGNSNSRAFEMAIKQADEYIDNEINNKIKDSI